MKSKVYYIGGPRDLSCEVLPEEPNPLVLVADFVRLPVSPSRAGYALAMTCHHRYIVRPAPYGQHQSEQRIFVAFYDGEE